MIEKCGRVNWFVYANGKVRFYRIEGDKEVPMTHKQFKRWIERLR